MPDKRQTSKQRRAARNRAQRDALAARRQNAGVATTRPAPSSTSSGTSTKTEATSTAAAPRTRSGKGRRPGDTALMVALGLSLVAFVLLLNTDIPVDERGEALPATFGGVAMLARAALTGGPVVDESENIVSHYGAGIVALMAVPLVVVAVVFLLNRRWEQRNRLLTFAMLGLAGVVVLTGQFGFYYMPALIALAVASFQVRKVEMPTRPTQPRPTRGASGRRGAIDVDEVDGEVEADDEPEVVTPAPSTRSRRSGGRTRRPSATVADDADADADAADTYEDGDVYDPETGEKDARPDAIDVAEAESVDEPAAAEPVEATTEDAPASGRSRGGLRRRGRTSGSGSTTAAEPAAVEPVEAGAAPVAADAAVAEPESGPVPAPDGDPEAEAGPAPDGEPAPEATIAAPDGDATVTGGAGEPAGAEPDDILAELEEELRREAEADEDDDPPTRR